MSDDKIIRLASVNNTVETTGRAAVESVVAFLRQWADKIEDGDELVTRAVLIMAEDRDGSFRLTTRRCNIDFVTQVGLMCLANHDLASKD